MNNRRAAFSLIELLIVVAIIGIIAGFGVPALQGILRGNALTQASGQMTDTVNLARQHAITKNKIVEVRFYRFGDPEVPGESATDPTSGQFRALQYFELNDAGIIIPVGKYQRLPDTIIMNPGIKLSSLLGEMTERLVLSSSGSFNKNVNPELPRGVKQNYDYLWFRFLPDGSTDLPPTGKTGGETAGGKYFITIHTLADRSRTSTDTVPPPDFFTWQIEPVSGTSKTFKPGLK
jgi:uncharacterized protein (TIGR02596 family)